MQGPRFFSVLNDQMTPQLQCVELSSSFQIPFLQIIGLPGPEVSEAKERVRAAVEAAGFEFPRQRIVLNLAPAGVKKRGTGLDLAMALSILNLAEAPKDQSHWIAWAELGLDGALKPAGSLLRMLHAALKHGIANVLVDHASYPDALEKLALLLSAEEKPATPPRIAPARNLAEAWEWVARGPEAWKERQTARSVGCSSGNGSLPIADVPISAAAPVTCAPVTVGSAPQIQCRSVQGLMPLAPSLERSLGIAAAGRHHLLLLGSRGVGKSHALDWRIALEPFARPEVQIAQGLLDELFNRPPGDGAGRDDHRQIRKVGMQVRPAALGGRLQNGSLAPGEFSLAHGGLLIADELPEWPRDSREALREPLENRTITLTRAGGGASVLPADFALAATGNFCPCGGWPHEFGRPVTDDAPSNAPPPRCRCRPAVKQAYLARLSGPILDRIDLLIQVRPLPPGSASLGPRKIQERIHQTQARLRRQWGQISGSLSGSDLEALLSEHPSLMTNLAQNQTHSLRSRHKILRLALTLAAWDDIPLPHSGHFLEATLLRPESGGWSS